MAQRPNKYRKSGYWRLPDGTEVVGLKRRPDGRFYAATHPTKTFGKDPSEALFRFRQWTDGESLDEQLIANFANRPAVPPDPQDIPAYVDELRAIAEAGEELMEQRWHRDNAPHIRQWTLVDPKGFAAATGVQDIISFSPPGPSKTLKAIGEFYFEHGRPTDEDWAKSCETWWRDFCRIVGGANVTVRDLTPEDIQTYRAEIIGPFKARKVSVTWVKHRFNLVKTVFNYALANHQDIENVQRAVTLCKMLKRPLKREVAIYGKKRGGPGIITPEQLDKLLAATAKGRYPEKWRAVFLLAANVLTLPSEAGSILKREIDLDAKTFSTDRDKSGEPRVAVLWDRTIEAIRAYQAAEPHDSEYLFVDETGKRYNKGHIRRNFERRRKWAGLPRTMLFKHLRSTGYTIASGETLTPQQQAKLMMGHALDGVHDNYAARDPHHVAGASELIEQRLFPNG